MIIGLTGKKGSGKTLVCDTMLQSKGFEHYGEYSLASPIKNIVNTLFGWSEAHSVGELKEREVRADYCAGSFNRAYALICHYDLESFSVNGGMSNVDIIIRLCSKFERTVTTPRKVYQWFGTELCRDNLDKDIWLKLVPKNIENLIISDVRFDNEATYITKQLGGVIVEIINNDRDEIIDDHSSESGISEPLKNIIFEAKLGLKDIWVYESSYNLLEEPARCYKEIIKKLSEL